MARSRTSSLWLVLWGGLLFQSFHPLAPLERLLDSALIPLRLAAELGAPVALLRARDVRAAERELAGAAQAEAAEGADTLARLAERALPGPPALRAGRRFLPGTVSDRPSKDECWVALTQAVSVPLGSPVVCGEAFAGRVAEVRGGRLTRARVELVTRSSFRVGAEVRGEEGGEPVFLTAGGVRAPRARRGPRVVELAVHQPSSNRLAGGLATVHELFADADAAAALGEGFRLGQVRRDEERGEVWIEPELDFLDGLFQVAIVLAGDAAAEAPPRPAPALEDGQWLATRALTFGDPSVWRSTQKIPLGAGAGVRAGAAVTGVGARLAGRVIQVGAATSSVALLSDPGFSTAAIARLAGDEEPRIVGRLTTLGRGPQGTVRMRWFVRMPLGAGGAPDAASVPARLFTGSGDPGLPGGLFLGTTELPLHAEVGEERELLVQPRFDPSALTRLFVRRETEDARP